MKCFNSLNVKIENMGKRREFFTVAGLSIIMIFGVMIAMGTFTSGYHLVDDHEFLEWIYQMQYQGE